jgi:uncharacterized membrane protein YadS
MGTSVALDRVISVGPMILLCVVVTVITTIITVEVLARGLFGSRDKIGSLLAAGSGICGVSAVVATAGSIEANERQIAYAAATILLFDTVTLFVYPVIGHVLGLSDMVFGVWAGLTTVTHCTTFANPEKTRPRRWFPVAGAISGTRFRSSFWNSLRSC